MATTKGVGIGGIGSLKRHTWMFAILWVLIIVSMPTAEVEAGWKTKAAAATCAINKACRDVAAKAAEKASEKCQTVDCAGKVKSVVIKASQWLKGYRDPAKIRYSQNSIKSEFRDGRAVKQLADDLKSGRVKPEDVPPIRLVKKDGAWYSIDNRRLKAFKDAGVAVRTRKATQQEIDEAVKMNKFTTTNDGASIRVRGE